MTSAVLRTLLVSAALACGACAHSQPAEQQAAAVVASTPSPRPECATAHVTLYFGETVASDEPVVTPLLNDFMTQIHACETAGGELRSITIATSSDPGQSASDGRAQIQRRQDRVRAALVNLGAPTDKITGATMPTGSIMGRRAEITANLY